MWSYNELTTIYKTLQEANPDKVIYRYLLEFVVEMAEHDCTYGDNCPSPNAKHGQCHGCQARSAMLKSLCSLAEKNNKENK